MAPDIFSFGPYILSQFLLQGGLPHGRPTPPEYVAVFYNYTHSLVIFFTVFGLAALLRQGRVWWPLAGWGLHVVIDIGTHTYEFFPTPFLFPVSSWKVSLLSWADPTFMLVNYTFLVLIYTEWYRQYRKSKFKIQNSKLQFKIQNF